MAWLEEGCKGTTILLLLLLFVITYSVVVVNVVELITSNIFVSNVCGLANLLSGYSVLSTKLSGLVILNTAPFIPLVILLSALSTPFSISFTTNVNGFVVIVVCGNIDDCAEPWFWFT